MIDDKVLVSRVLGGEAQAFRLLIQQYERLVLHMVGRLIKNDAECEEICQDVFVRVYQKLADFNFESRLSTWIGTIAYRHAINALRKRKHAWSDIPDEDQFSSAFIEADNPESLIVEEDSDLFVMKLVDLLPPQYKIVLTLYHIDGMTYPEIGQITGMPEGTVKNYLFRARNLLKEKVKKYLGKEELL